MTAVYTKSFIPGYRFFTISTDYTGGNWLRLSGLTLKLLSFKRFGDNICLFFRIFVLTFFNFLRSAHSFPPFENQPYLSRLKGFEEEVVICPMFLEAQLEAVFVLRLATHLASWSPVEVISVFLLFRRVLFQ